MRPDHACDECLRRSWLIARLSRQLDLERSRIMAVLELADEPLLMAVAGRDHDAIYDEYVAHDPGATRARCLAEGLTSLCGCDERYPAALRALPSPPATLFIATDDAQPAAELTELLAAPSVAVVGSRRPTEGGLATAHQLGNGLAGCGIPVISGMAFGIDAAVHRGALEVPQGRTVAVLAGSPSRPYPAAHRNLHRQIRAAGCVISEMPPGSQARRWGFVARNRIIAALAEMTVVVEGEAASGSIVTARCARELGRGVGAVPGRVTSPVSRGPHQLIRDGATLIRDCADVLEAIGAPTRDTAGVALVKPGRSAEASSGREVSAAARGLLAGLQRERPLDRATAEAELGPAEALAALAELELAGLVLRAGGQWCAA